ncbi:MAG: hypothetical protein K8S20_04640 [Chloroflexi bacterium]|nr:hypothetical protein [Chloroflexota bacterium]
MSAFDELEGKYPEIVDQLPDRFDSHDFILVLAQRYQQLYVSALSEYSDNHQPFQTVHSEIARRLNNHAELVKHIGDRPSRNIFGQVNDAAVWQKVKSQLPLFPEG